jgi:hypothetical protein
MAVTLQNPNKVKTPSWLTDTSASDKLNETYGQLGSLFDTSGLQNAANAWRDTSMARYEMGADAMARAAQNRAMLNGGRVGASFAKGGLMLGAMQEGNRMNYDYAKLAAQMASQRANLQGSLAGNIASYGLGRQNLLSGWTQGQQQMNLSAQQSNQSDALERYRLAQQQSQYDSTLEQQNDQFDKTYNLNLQNAAAQRALSALQAMPNQRISYNVYNSGQPMSIHDAENKTRSDQQYNTRMNLLNQIAGGYY